MPSNTYDRFVKIDHYGDTKLGSELELNLKWYLDWSFLKIGAWQNVESGTTQGHFGGDFYTLKPIHDPNYTDGRIWEGPRKDWCFETGVSYNSPSFNVISINGDVGGGTGLISTQQYHNLHVGDTVTIEGNSNEGYNGTFDVVEIISTNIFYITSVPTGTGTGGSIISTINPIEPQLSVNDNIVTTGTSGYEYHINYPLGRVVFDVAKNTGTTTVVADYSFRLVQTYIADSVPWIMEVQFDTFRPDHNNWDNIDFVNKGEWAINAPHRIQLPAIVIESVEYQGGKPYQLGDLSSWENPQVIFHVLAENRFERNNLVNILTNQKGHTIYLLNTDEVARQNYFPLDYRGMVLDDPLMYPDVVELDDVRWLKCYFKEVNVSQMVTNSPHLFYSRVRGTFEVILPGS